MGHGARTLTSELAKQEQAPSGACFFFPKKIVLGLYNISKPYQETSAAFGHARRNEATMNQRIKDLCASDNHGWRTWRASGATYEWREELKLVGFRWDAGSRAWYRRCDASKMPAFRQAIVDIHDNSNGAVRFSVNG